MGISLREDKIMFGNKKKKSFCFCPDISKILFGIDSILRSLVSKTQVSTICLHYLQTLDMEHRIWRDYQSS
ncbi:unnamed protein product [Brassica rapa]|uniref:Uncharacterized protein n=2 Tax=Brassica TaxID=3705 RepID=A0A8D9DC07_BRACM|nr:unnamed protein product [Brassica napus]CAG7872734.1 unnamed protein product [Brassica rapa]